MILFIVGTLIVLALLAWATYRTAEYLRRFPPSFNLLLLPPENLLRLILIYVCTWLAQLSGQPYAQFGWDAAQPARDVVIGFAIGILVALVLPPLTQLAVARLGSQVYSPVVLRSILPRNRREWLLVPLALAPSVLLEELLFRSLLLGGFAILAPPVLLAIVWSIVFGAMHLPQGAFGIVVAAALGLLLSALFLTTASLLAPFIAHFVINLLQLVWAAQDKSVQVHDADPSRHS
ncbi:MAG: CPBP family intramembrane metalloprotease [Chloroflexota bacterium]|nr:CPBP family intramembrane metalloprotease [Chloroflexota bacterium]